MKGRILFCGGFGGAWLGEHQVVNGLGDQLEDRGRLEPMAEALKEILPGENASESDLQEIHFERIVMQNLL